MNDKWVEGNLILSKPCKIFLMGFFLAQTVAVADVGQTFLSA